MLDFCTSVQDYKPEEDPCRYKSVKTGRGPLGKDWKVPNLVLLALFLASIMLASLIPSCLLLCLQKELHAKKDCPHMCAYKLVTVKFKWWGLQNKVENFIQKVCVDSDSAVSV